MRLYVIQRMYMVTTTTILRQMNASWHVHCSSTSGSFVSVVATTTQSWRRNRKPAIVSRAAADVVRLDSIESLNATRGHREKEKTNGGRESSNGHLDARMRDHARLSLEEDSDEERSVVVVSEKEMNRREKISRANKGKVPWNKGKNMTEEVKAKISQKTYEAMQRPDVRARMKKANANRAPHSDEVRKRIREVLRKRADDARRVITLQTEYIVTAMEESEDPREQDIARNNTNAREIIGKLAWRVLHRDFETMYDKWEHNTDGFRDAVILRFEELGRRKKPRKKKVSKIKETARTQDKTRQKIVQAEEKLQSVEEALAKLKTLKAAYKDNPESLSIVVQKEVQTTDLLEKLREQVDLLHKSMETSPVETSVQQQPPKQQVENSNVSVLDSKWDTDSEASTLTQLPWGKRCL